MPAWSPKEKIKMSRWMMVPQNHRKSSQATVNWASNATTWKFNPCTVRKTTRWTLTCWRSCLTNHFARIWCSNLKTHLWSWPKIQCTRRMPDLSLQSLCSRNLRYPQSLSVKTLCWLRSLVDVPLLLCSTLGTKLQQRLQFMMATPYRRVLCAIRLVVRPCLRCCKITWVRCIIQRLNLDTHSSASLRQWMVRNTLMFKVCQCLMSTLPTTAGVNHRSSTISRHNYCISMKSL